MTTKRALNRARAELGDGKSPSTTAGEFIREEIEHVRDGKHDARSAQQAKAISLSKARRAGIPLKPPPRGKVSGATRENPNRDCRIGQTDPQTA